MEQDKLVDLVRINVELGCGAALHCEDCYCFFNCTSPHKQDFYHSHRFKTVAKGLSHVKHIVAVMSGKGGVGKSIISANLAVALAGKGYSTAILDSDLYGPSIPGILGVEGERLKSGPRGIVPPQGPSGIKIVSMAFLLGDEGAVTWLSDTKRSTQELFLANTEYGNLDYLIIDMPPGTGSETVNLLKYLPQTIGALIVAVPTDIAERVVHRCVSLCQKAGTRILGLVENMSSFSCPRCSETYMPEHGSGDILAREAGAPLLGKIARDPVIVNAADRGKSFLLDKPDSQAAKNFLSIVDKLEEKVGSKGQKGVAPLPEAEETSLLEIVEINVDHSCYNRSCWSCAEYFQCSYPRKYNLRDSLAFKNIREAMSGVKHKIAVMSCKGGVGKSTFSANLAAALALKGKKVTILDCDFHGPCIPRILGVEGKTLQIGKKGIVPVPGLLNIGVVSVAFLIQPDEAVTWFDTLKKTTVEQLLSGVNYGDIDYLIVDLPPGTGGESYGLLQFTPDLDGAVVITLPSENPQTVARRSINLCRQAGVPVLGIVENMSRFVCPRCKAVSRMCGVKGAKGLAGKSGVRYLGDIPLDNSISRSCDEGIPFVYKYPDSAAARCVFNIARKLEAMVENPAETGRDTS